MDNWQFLIQKQGERTWKPLESSKLKLMEGRYRVVAKSNLPNTDVEVRVTHTSLQEVPPKKRLHKRSRRTNSEGLMGVIPFTFLEPGIWKVQCSGDVMSDMLGQSWEYSVQLQVLPQVISENLTIDIGEKTVPEVEPQPQNVEHKNTVNNKTQSEIDSVKITNFPPEAQVTSESPTIDTQDDAEFTKNVNTLHPPLRETTDPKSTISNADSEENEFIEPYITPLELKGETAEQILQNLIELAIPSSESLLEDEPNPDDVPAPITELPLLLNLDAKTYIATWGETFSINGRLECKTVSNSQQNRVYRGELQIELRSPQGAEIISQIRQPLQEQLLLPFSFTSNIDIPGEWESKLLLADIYLYGAWESGTQAILLASQSFTITAEVTELLAISTAKSTQLEVIDNTQTASIVVPEPSVSLGLELFNLVKTRKKGQFLRTKASNKKSIPPKIDPRKLRKSSPSRSLKLPNLPNQNQKISRRQVASETPTNKPENLETGSITVVTASLEISEQQPLLPGSIKTTFPYLKRIQSPDVSIPPETLSLELDTPETVTEDTSFPETSSEEENLPENSILPGTAELIVEDNPNLSPLIRKWIYNQGFSLPQPIDVQFQDYDMEIVTGTAEDEELGVPTQWESQSEETNPSEEIFTAPPPLPPITPPAPSKVKRKKIALEILAEDAFSQPQPETVNELQEEQQPNLSVIQPQDTIPIQPLSTPQLYIPETELIAGKSLRVRVEIPEMRPLIAVKLWISDYQTRLLLNGPHLLTNLLPNGKGGLEISTQLNVPFGCLEMRIEAIALELTTQQESHKVTVIRTVVPEDLPKSRVEELLGI
ncbi:MAG: hypothetical protein QNJ47_13880 [Nostocaceae cyanobacterium]|nr:hypothetical protein [Nostocaceae cyanobacterium]